jgi:hypothetical protein
MHTNNSAYPEPSYTSTNMPSNKEFHVLDVINTNFVDLILSPSNDSTRPDIYVSNYIWAFGKYSVTLHHGSKEGHILGVLKIAPFSSSNLTGVGDPNVYGGEETVWGSLDRTSKWTHSTYEFGWCGKKFTWLRTRMSAFSDQPDLELRENVQSDVSGGTNGAKSGEIQLEAEVLAIYKGTQGRGCTGQRGTFWVSKGGAGFENKPERRKVGIIAEEWSNWEIMVLLTGCGVVEACRRRSRQRRGGGGG